MRSKTGGGNGLGTAWERPGNGLGTAWERPGNEANEISSLEPRLPVPKLYETESGTEMLGSRLQL